MINTHRIVFLVFLAIASVSCESQEDRQERLAREEAAQIQRDEIFRQKRIEDSIELVKLWIEAAEIAKESGISGGVEGLLSDSPSWEPKKPNSSGKAKEEYDRYISNSLYTGSTPYSYCYGGNPSCEDWGCSDLEVVTPSNSDVVVTIKKDGDVVRHAYIRRGSRYKFELPNGTYQPYFYYGVGWNPNKLMKELPCGKLKGGFIESEHFGKDDPQSLVNSILTYELILQQGGNFTTRPSNAAEAF